MRIIFKILAAPFVLVLTLLVAVLSFLLGKQPSGQRG